MGVKFLFILMLLLAGCSTKEYTLFQDKHAAHEVAERDQGLIEMIFPREESPEKNLDNVVVSEIPVSFRYMSKILPADMLKIDIYNKSKKLSLNDAVDAKQSASSAGKSSEYLVDVDGTIYLPLLGEVMLKGMTEKEAGAYLSQKYKSYLKEPYVKVNITNTRIYVLGEVAKPGVITIPPSGISLYEVLAKSGDFTDHAKRNAIDIISGPLGRQTIRTIDMTSLASINATNLMISPNSIVYVPPRYMKSVKVTLDDYMPILQAISSMLGTYLSIDYVTRGRK